ncbi:MAG TPA: hypothetical protein VFB39_10830 [Solirubrobacteraceae bacterium]|nr:hypothetical protein [Solirubrobacteraceae bacterium]
MPTDRSLQALREASPRRRPRFGESIAHHDMLRTQITATPIPARRQFPRLSSRRRALGLSAAAAVVLSLGGVLVAATLSATSPPSAYAAARKAVGATAAARSGTMTVSIVHGATTWRLETTRWNGPDVAMSADPSQGHLQAGPDRQILIIGGGAYAQTADGHWIHYSSAYSVGPKLGPQLQLARDNVAGSTAKQILALVTRLHRVVKPGGTTIYTGTIDNSNSTAVAPTDDAIMGMIVKLRSGNRRGAPGGYHNGLHLKMLVDRSGLARQVSLTFQQHRVRSSAHAGTWTWSVTYSRLGSTPPIAQPASFTQARRRN